jgi:4-diphosphocytidyl-2C-methyl-D-erythritol kinase
MRVGWFVVVVPPWEVENKTAAVYRAVEPADFGDGRRTHALAEALRARQDVDQRMFVNTLARAAYRVFRDLEPLKDELEGAVGATFQVSGAGPALYHYCTDREVAKRCAERAETLGVAVHVVRPLTRLTAVRSVE